MRQLNLALPETPKSPQTENELNTRLDQRADDYEYRRKARELKELGALFPPPSAEPLPYRQSWAKVAS